MNNLYFDLLNYLIDNNKLICIPNYYYRGFECDIFTISKKMYTTEYEIKISKSDFIADFKKQRNYYDSERKKTILNSNKHNEICGGRRTNRFYFVIPRGLNIDVPSYAGLIEFYYKYKLINFSIIKTAPFLHKNKIDGSIFKELANNLNWRYYNLFYENIKLKNKYEC